MESVELKKPLWKKWWVWVLGLIILGAIASVASGGGGTVAPTTAVTQPATRPTAAASGLTMTKFKVVKSGMSLTQVQKILGSEGTEQSSVDIAGTHTVMQMWANDDGANMNATFQNDKLMSKAQFGLK